MVMSGSQMSQSLPHRGNRTLTVTGSGRIADGAGSRMKISAGLRITTAAGFVSPESDGSGSPVMSGRRGGCPGVIQMMMITSAGHPCRPKHLQRSTLAFIHGATVTMISDPPPSLSFASEILPDPLTGNSSFRLRKT